MKKKSIKLIAEDELRKKNKKNTLNVRQLSEEDIIKLIHNLEVHQIELELQNQELSKAKEEIELIKNKYFDIFEHAPIGYFILSKNDLILKINAKAASILGYKKSELLNTYFYYNIPREKRDEYHIHKQKLIKPGESSKNTIEIQKKDGTLFWAHIESELVYDQTVFHKKMVLSDVTDAVKRQEEIDYMNNHDYLTNLHNRRYYFKKLKEYNQTKFHPLGIMFFDINGLKLYNDAFGHAVGDNVILTAAKYLDLSIGHLGIIARLGGDEFASIIPNCNTIKIQNIQSTIEEALKLQKIKNIEISLAIGSYVREKENEDLDTSLKNAENLMYRHKILHGKSVRSNAISAILTTLTNKHPIELDHSNRVSSLCNMMGMEMKLMREDEISELTLAGKLHDIGKITIPDKILNKEGPLTESEFNILKTHTEAGYQILKAADEYSDLAVFALHHHERWDGTGYPKGLQGNEIPFFCRIISIVDAYEAMTADRTYRKKFSHSYAISEIKRCSGTQFDPNITKIFTEAIEKNATLRN